MTGSSFVAWISLVALSAAACSATQRAPDSPAAAVPPVAVPEPTAPNAAPRVVTTGKVRRPLRPTDSEAGNGPRTELGIFYGAIGLGIGSGACALPCGILGASMAAGLTVGLTDDTFTWGQAQLIEGAAFWSLTHAGILALGDADEASIAFLIATPLIGPVVAAPLAARWRPRSGTVALMNSAWMWTSLLLGTNTFAPDLRRPQPGDATRAVAVLLGADVAAAAAALLAKDLRVSRARVIVADLLGLVGFAAGAAIGDDLGNRPAAGGAVGALAMLAVVLGTGLEAVVPEGVTAQVRLAPWLLPDGAGVWLLH